MDIVDISQEGIDAALEIQRVCPALYLAKEYGFESPCRVLCEMEQEATRRAFPGIKATILSRQVAGNCVCTFKYEKPAKTATLKTQNKQNLFSRILAWIQVTPKILQIGIKLLKNQFSQS